MYSIYGYIINRKPTLMKKSFLYSLGSVLFSLSSMLWLVVVTRVLDTFASGVFSIGWAICQQMATIGYFGMRNVQVSDIDDEIGSGTFILVKFFSILSMLGVSVIYCLYLGLSSEKVVISILLTILMATESLADLSAGFFQKNDRLDITGLSYIIRVSLYSITFIFSILIYKSLILSIFLAILLSFFWLIVFDFPILLKMNLFKFDGVSYKSIINLFFMCLPIFFSSYLTNLLITIPKNSIELNLTTVDQSMFNLIFMPSSIMKMALGILLIPLYRKITLMWKDRDYSGLKKFIIMIIVAIFFLTIVLIVLTILIGIPFLTIVYGVSISSQEIPLILLIIAGSLNGIATFFIFILTVFNRQFYLLYIYGITVLLSMAITNKMVINYHILGASGSYLITSTILLSFLCITCIFFFKKEEKNN